MSKRRELGAPDDSIEREVADVAQGEGSDAAGDLGADPGPWPAATWGPLYPEHFALRTLDDLAKLPPSGVGRA